MGHRQDDPYSDSPYGYDTAYHPAEDQFRRDMTAGADERPLYVAPALIDATNADSECRHGNLPADRDIDCDCWDSRRTVPLEPFRQRFAQMEPAVREGHALGGPGRQPKDAATLVALRLGWFHRGGPDGARVRRTLGLKPHPTGLKHGKFYPPTCRQRTNRRTALQLCEAMNLDPADVGL